MRFFTLIFVFVSFISCSQPDYVPSGEKIISEEKMIDILIDFHVAEAGVQEGRIKSDKSTKHISTYYTHIYNFHRVSKEDFQSTFEYYVSHPTEFDALYEKINEKMKLEEEKLKEAIAKRRKDIKK